MVNTDERTEQSEIGGLLVFYHYLFLSIFERWTVEEDKGVLIQ